MTHRLYYNDPYKRRFEATIVAVGQHDGRPTARLDQSAFYPTSGGQPFDTGVLVRHGAANEHPPGSATKVLDVFEDADQAIVHVLQPTPAWTPQPGDAVRGEVDWPRRFDHMQQHTGQHLLSAAFDRLFAVRTVGFHLGAEACTIDLSREATASEIASAEAEANRIIWENRPVAIRFVSAEEAAALPLRKDPSREGMLRLIEIDGFDLSACGGTHVSRTGAVGIVTALGWERFKGGQRLLFAAGRRALDRFRSLRDDMHEATRRASSLPGELAGAIERLQNEAKDLRRSTAALQVLLAGFQAAELASSGEPAPGGLAVLRAVDADAGMLKALVSRIVAGPGRIAVLVSKTPPLNVVVGASAGSGCAANELLAALLARHQGRGGGKSDLAQGGGIAASPEDVLATAREIILTPRAHQ